MHLHHYSSTFLPLASPFATFWLWHAQKSKFWDRSLSRPKTMSLGFSIFLIFFLAFPFSPFLFFLLQWLTFYWTWLRLKNFWESVIETGNFHHGAARCSGSKFWYKFFAPLFEHFCAYLRLHSADPLIWASLERSSLAEVEQRWGQFWSKVMMSEVEERPRLVRAG